MATHEDKQMLRDANGDLIPQYWDIQDEEFKPLTGQDGAQDTRLTGSKVGLVDSKSSIEITAGSGVYVFGNQRNHDGWYSQYNILLSASLSYEKFRVEIDERPPQIGSNPTIFRVYDEEMSRLEYTGFLDVISSAVRVRVYNESNSDSNVDIWMYGRV